MRQVRVLSHYTNGFTEGCNNKIKVLKRNAYGYKNFRRFRNRILHIFSHKQLNKEQTAAYQQTACTQFLILTLYPNYWQRVQKRCCRKSYGSVFAFVSDFNPCYKIAFEKQGVHPISIWWSIAGSNRWPLHCQCSALPAELMPQNGTLLF